MAPGSSESNEIAGVPSASTEQTESRKLKKKGLQCGQVWQTCLERSQFKGMLVILSEDLDSNVIPNTYKLCNLTPVT